MMNLTFVTIIILLCSASASTGVLGVLGVLVAREGGRSFLEEIHDGFGRWRGMFEDVYLRRLTSRQLKV